MIRATNADAVRESIAREERDKVKPGEKKQSSQFDDVLKEQAQRAQQPSIMRQALTQTATEQAVRQEKREEDKGHDKKKDREKGEERESIKGSEADRKTDAKTAEQKVVAKKDLSDDRGRGHGGGAFGGYSGDKQASSSRTKTASGKEGPVMLKAQFAKKLTAAMKTPARVFTEHAINQIVKYVRLGINSAEEKELKMEFEEKFFKGLKLKVTKKGKGRVSVHFATANSEVRDMFRSNSGELKKALFKRGIDVDEISVS